MPFTYSARTRLRAGSALSALAMLTALSGCGQDEPPVEDPQKAFDRAVAEFDEAGRGTYAVLTTANGTAMFSIEGAWQREPARYRGTSVLQEEGATETVSSTLVEDATHRWTLRPQFHQRNDCWERDAADALTAGTPGMMRLLMDGVEPKWTEDGTVLSAQGPAAAAISALGDLSGLLPEVPDTAQVEFSLLLEKGRVAAIRTDLSAAFASIEAAGVELPRRLAPFAAETAGLETLASFSGWGEDVDTNPPPAKKVRDC